MKKLIIAGLAVSSAVSPRLGLEHYCPVMKRKTLRMVLATALLAPLLLSAIEDVPLDVEERISLWPKGKVPDYDSRQGDALLEVVRVPEVRSDALVIVIGGGSYVHLPFVYNPADMVEALRANGVRCVNLRHRCPRPRGKPKHLSAWQDVQRAVRVCRANAERWNVSPDKIGVIGFSAGGHCALLAAVSSQTPAYAPVDALDAQPCNVNFAVPVYPAYVLDGCDNITNGFTDGRKGHEKDWTLPLGNELKFDSATPPIFLLHGAVDELVPVMGTLIVFNRLLKMGVSVEMQISSRDGHGFLIDDNWRGQIVKWMKDRNLLSGARRAKSPFRTLECLPTPEHERNSEGSVCKMPNGELLFAYSRFGKGK